ncbi:MAG: hypothetical protein ACREF4_16525 [Gammaproteobacteria bacterium]
MSQASAARPGFLARSVETDVPAVAHSGVNGECAPTVARFTSGVRARRRRARARHCLSWAQLLQRVFLVDVLQCPRCAGRMRLIAAIVDRKVAARILAHLGLPARAPPRCPAREKPSAGSREESDLP